MRRCRGPGVDPRPALQQRGEGLEGERCPLATSSIVPTSTRFMWRMKVSAWIQNSSRSPCSRHRAREHVALEAHVVGLGRREGGEVVRPGERRRAGVQRLALQLPPPPERVTALERRAAAAVEQPVAVGTAERVAARIEASPRGSQASTATSSGRRALSRADRPPRGVAGHLAPGVHAAVGAPGDGQRHGLAQERLQRALELLLNAAQAGLARPAHEVGAVVLERELGDRPSSPCDRGRSPGPAASGGPARQTSSRKTISVESERRGPSLRMRV